MNCILKLLLVQLVTTLIHFTSAKSVENCVHDSTWKEGCNYCYCHQGLTACTRNICKENFQTSSTLENQHLNARSLPPQNNVPSPGVEGGKLKPCQHGAAWYEDCNACYCHLGVTACTEKKCLANFNLTVSPPTQPV